MTLLDGHNRPQAIGRLAVGVETSQTGGKLRVIPFPRPSGLATLPAEATKLSKMSNQYEFIVHHNSSFMALMPAFWHIARAFEPKYGVCYVYSRVKYITEELTYVAFLDTKNSAVYTRHEDVAKRLMSYTKLLPLIESPSERFPT